MSEEISKEITKEEETEPRGENAEPAPGSRPKLDPSRSARWHRSLQVLWIMFRLGFFTWGGGWSIVAQLQREFVDKRSWLSQEELMDIVSVGRSMPGIMIMNISVLFGYHIGGMPGVACSVLGIASPSVIVMCLVTLCYTWLRDNVWVARALVGIRAAVIPIIGGSALRMRKAAWVDKWCYLITLGALLLCLFTDLHNIFIVLAGACAGLILKGREAKKDGAVS